MMPPPAKTYGLWSRVAPGDCSISPLDRVGRWTLGFYPFGAATFIRRGPEPRLT